MKILLSFLFMVLLATVHASDSKVYELRTYIAEPGKVDDLVSRLQSASQLFTKHGMENVIFWAPYKDKETGQDRMTYVLGHKSRDAAAASWKAFVADPEWHKLRDANEANGKVVTKVDSTFLVPTDYSPPVKV